MADVSHPIRFHPLRVVCVAGAENANTDTWNVTRHPASLLVSSRSLRNFIDSGSAELSSIGKVKFFERSKSNPIPILSITVDLDCGSSRKCCSPCCVINHPSHMLKVDLIRISDIVIDHGPGGDYVRCYSTFRYYALDGSFRAKC